MQPVEVIKGLNEALDHLDEAQRAHEKMRMVVKNRTRLIERLLGGVIAAIQHPETPDIVTDMLAHTVKDVRAMAKEMVE